MEIVINDLGIDIFPLGIALLALALLVLRRRGHTWPYLFCFALFWVYLQLALKETFFPLQINGTYVEVMRQEPLESHINLAPFFFRYGLNQYLLLGLLQNLLLTVPFGFGINFIQRVRLRKAVWLSLAVGLGIESAQLLLSLLLGYPYRVIDINDAILNLAGFWLGYGLFRLCAWAYLAVLEKRHPRPLGAWDFFYRVADGGEIK